MVCFKSKLSILVRFLPREKVPHSNNWSSFGCHHTPRKDRPGALRRRASGWKDDKTAPSVAREISVYAQTNPFEDFAETYALYRLDPTRLKALSSARYTYMRDRVFDGIEYTQDPCSGSKGQNQARR